MINAKLKKKKKLCISGNLFFLGSTVHCRISWGEICRRIYSWNGGNVDRKWLSNTFDMLFINGIWPHWKYRTSCKIKGILLNWVF